MQPKSVIFDHVSKTYSHWKKQFRQAVQALVDLSFDIQEGEVLGLIGPNGAGKTTAIKILMGLSFPTNGKAHVFGSPPGSKQANRNIGYVAETAYYYPFLEAKALLSYYAKLSGVLTAEIHKRINESLDLVQLTPHADRRIGDFSKGMQQRLGIAQALLPGPKLLVLDEPTSGLDPIGQHEVVEILRKLREEGMTILLSSHQLAEVEGLCNKIVMIHKGRTLFQGTLSQLSSTSSPRQFVIRFQNLSSPFSTTMNFSLPGLGFQNDVPRGEVEIKTEEGDVDAALDELRSNGCKILLVAPVVSRLNEIFYQMIMDADQGSAISQ